MSKINLLPKAVAELIAAGEVVERPASIIKELVENSIDAGATQITVEIQRGGITYIRITDNGSGIDTNDVPIAFLRHATSKIKTNLDLDSIATLGFRGEALAAVSSVSRVEMLTCTESSSEGTHYVIEGGEEKLYEEAGCPKGTTIIIRDIFYNTPARMKFLKKDVSEGNACAGVVERIALSHPEIAFKLIRDGKQALFTSGDNNLKNCVYSCLGREFASSLIEVEAQENGIFVSGLTCKPVFCKATRNSQYTFLNGRLVRSGTVIAAVEQAYKNSAMVGKFPAFVLFLNIPFDTVDVNVHPAKTEVRFSDEKRIFESVYLAVRNAITQRDTRPEVKLEKPTFNPFQSMTAAEFRQERIKETAPPVKKTFTPSLITHKEEPLMLRSEPKLIFIDKEPEPKTEIKAEIKEAVKERVLEEVIEEKPQPPEIFLLGEAFSTYIVVQMDDSLYMIDKHAAHERILFNRLNKETEIESQALLTPVTVVLNSKEYDAIVSNADLFDQSGFEIEDFGNSSVIVRAVPVFLTKEDLSALVSEMAESILTSGRVNVEKKEQLLHTIACRSAVKAGNSLSRSEMLELAQKILWNKEIMYCPHGRPVAFRLKKRELEKQFGRIQ